MARLIDADALKARIGELCLNNDDMFSARAYERIIGVIEAMPTITAEPKRGRWILSSDEEFEYCTCSECGYQNGENWMIGSEIKYCENCGAKMDEPDGGAENGKAD